MSSVTVESTRPSEIFTIESIACNLILEEKAFHFSYLCTATIQWWVPTFVICTPFSATYFPFLQMVSPFPPSHSLFFPSIYQQWTLIIYCMLINIFKCHLVWRNEQIYFKNIKVFTLLFTLHFEYPVEYFNNKYCLAKHRLNYKSYSFFRFHLQLPDAMHYIPKKW